MKKKYKLASPMCLLLVVVMLTCFSTPCGAFKLKSKQKQKKEAQITAGEVQAILMSYADILSTALGQIALSLKEEDLPTDVRTHVLTDLATTVFAVYTNAADPDPIIGLLNTAVIISFGKIVYETPG